LESYNIQHRKHYRRTEAHKNITHETTNEHNWGGDRKMIIALSAPFRFQIVLFHFKSECLSLLFLHRRLPLQQFRSCGVRISTVDYPCRLHVLIWVIQAIDSLTP